MTSHIKPAMTLLVKLGSIAVHAQEYLSPGGHEFDRVTLQSLISDREVCDWLRAMQGDALLPVVRPSSTKPCDCGND